MNRRALYAAIPALLLSAPAWCASTGFALTHEEGLSFPPLRQFTTGYDAAIGKVQIFSDNAAFLDDDPAGVKSGCDLTSTTALVLDGTSRVVEAHMAFPMIAAGRLTILDKVQIGAERTDRDGLKIGVYSGTTRRPESDVELRRDGFVYVFGQKVDIGGGNFLRYENVFLSDCTKGIDNHITVEMFHNLVGGTVLVQLTTHGATGNTYRVGPFPMSPEVKAEGIAGIWAFVSPESGRYTVDGMVCVGDAPVILPTGSEKDSGERRRY